MHHRRLVSVLAGWSRKECLTPSCENSVWKKFSAETSSSINLRQASACPRKKGATFSEPPATPIGYEFSQSVITPLISCQERKKNFIALWSQYMSQRKENKNEKIDDGALDFVNVPFINLQEKSQKDKSHLCCLLCSPKSRHNKVLLCSVEPKQKCKGASISDFLTRAIDLVYPGYGDLVHIYTCFWSGCQGLSWFAVLLLAPLSIRASIQYICHLLYTTLPAGFNRRGHR